MNEYEYEAVRGLPGRLPEGESILWQGAPNWRVLARRTFHLRSVALYFALIAVVRGTTAVVVDGASVSAGILAGLLFVPFALLGLAILAGLAAWHARTTVYTITNHRVVLRYGIAVQLAVNLPFKEIGGADLLELWNGHGDLSLKLTGTGRMAYLHLWPHARPGVWGAPQPMLRSVPNAAHVAQVLTTAWSEDRQVAVSEPSPSCPATVRRLVTPADGGQLAGAAG